MTRDTPEYLAIIDLPPPIQGISLVSTWMVQYLKDKNVDVKVVNTSVKNGRCYPFRRFVRFIPATFEALKSNSQRSIYVALSHGKTLYAQAVIIAFCRMKRQRVIVHHHTFLPINSPKMLINWICHSLMRRGVEHIFLSDYMKRKYLQVWNPMGKCWVVTNHQIAWLRTESQRENYKLNLGNKICFAGRMSEEKGFWDCESITRTLLRKDSDMNAVFLGPITDPVIFQALEKMKRDFPQRFDHIGPYDELTLSRNLQDSTYFLFPSRYSNEASPLVVLEAQALGNICITSDVGTLRTDVLSPGAALGMETWLAKAIEIIQRSKSDLSSTKLISETIKQKSSLLAENCTNQMKEVFNL